MSVSQLSDLTWGVISSSVLDFYREAVKKKTILPHDRRVVAVFGSNILKPTRKKDLKKRPKMGLTDNNSATACAFILIKGTLCYIFASEGQPKKTLMCCTVDLYVHYTCLMTQVHLHIMCLANPTPWRQRALKYTPLWQHASQTECSYPPWVYTQCGTCGT